MKIEIKSILTINTFTDENGLEIPLKQGHYDVIVKKEELTLISEKERFDPEKVKWEYVGEEDYASIGSDFPFVIIKDKKSEVPEIYSEWLLDNVHNFYEFLDSMIFEIPCGNGGALSVFTTKNEKGHIIGVLINGVHPEDM